MCVMPGSQEHRLYHFTNAKHGCLAASCVKLQVPDSAGHDTVAMQNRAGWRAVMMVCGIVAAGHIEGALAQLPRYLAAERAVLEVHLTMLYGMLLLLSIDAALSCITSICASLQFQKAAMTLLPLLLSHDVSFAYVHALLVQVVQYFLNNSWCCLQGLTQHGRCNFCKALQRTEECV